MSLLKSPALSRKVRYVAVLCAASSALSALLLSSRAPRETEAASVSYKQDRIPANASARANASAPASSGQALAKAPPAAPAKPLRRVDSVKVNTTLEDAAQRLGVTSATTATLIRGFGKRINLKRDLQVGDTLSVVYQSNGAGMAGSEPLLSG